MKFLVLLAQAHEEFRITELQALADLHNIELDFSGYTPEVCMENLNTTLIILTLIWFQ